MKSCKGKKCFATFALAEEALIETRIKFNYAAGFGPVAVYRCDDCGFYHLTSKGEVSDRLNQQISSGKIQQQKEANYWLDKLKHKGK